MSAWAITTGAGATIGSCIRRRPFLIGGQNRVEEYHIDARNGKTQQPSKQEPLRVVARRPDGIIVRGAKGVGTQAPYANELFCMTAPRPNLTPEESVYFATPVNAAGIHLVC